MFLHRTIPCLSPLMAIILIICQHFSPNYCTLSNLLAEKKTVAARSFFHASTWTLTPCVALLICSSLGGEIGGRSLGEIDGKMGWNLLSGSERMESALMGIKGTLEWESLDNVLNFFQEVEDSNLLSNPFAECACKINFLLFRTDHFFMDSFELDSI